MVAGSSKVLIYSASAMQETNEEEAHKHKHRAILTFTTPVLCGVSCIARVVGLAFC